MVPLIPTPWVLLLVSCGSFFAGRWSCAAARKEMLIDVAPEVLPLLYDPPRGHGAVEVPSVKRDARGAVHNLQIGSFRFNVLESAKGTLRSGDVHKSPQLDMIFSGRVRVTTREGGRDVVREYTSGDLAIIPANVPHIFHFLNETIMAEWWESGAFETRYFTPYRRKVDAALHELRRGRGRKMHA